MITKYAVFTRHAHERLRECNITIAKASWMLYSSEVDDIPKDIRKYKREKYGADSLHLRYGTVLFTLVPAVDKYTGDDIYLVLSVFDQNMSRGAKL